MRLVGLLVVPAAPALKDLGTKASYREALVNADLAITDSAYMVMVWNRLQHDSIRRLSGSGVSARASEAAGRSPAGQCAVDYGEPGECGAEPGVAAAAGN